MRARVRGVDGRGQVPAKVAEGEAGEEELEDQADEVGAEVGGGDVLEGGEGGEEGLAVAGWRWVEVR